MLDRRAGSASPRPGEREAARDFRGISPTIIQSWMLEGLPESLINNRRERPFNHAGKSWGTAGMSVREEAATVAFSRS